MGMCSRTVVLDSFTQTLSFHNNNIAVGSESGDIIILDTITGTQTALLSGHTDEVNCVAFSPDGTSLVSGSDDYTVKLWDVQTGGIVNTFSGHTGRFGLSPFQQTMPHLLQGL
jgi:WD40 repeat protein